MPTLASHPFLAVLGIAMAFGQMWALWLLIRGKFRSNLVVWQLGIHWLVIGVWAVFLCLASYKLAFVLLDNLRDVDWHWACHSSERHIFPGELFLSLLIGLTVTNLFSRNEMVTRSRMRLLLYRVAIVILFVPFVILLLLLPYVLLPETIYSLCAKPG